MDDESPDRSSLTVILGLIGLAGCAAAFCAAGGLALLGGAVAVASLAGSIVASLAPGESSCERYARECETAAADHAAANADTSVEPQTTPNHHWRQCVEASRYSCRKR